MPTTNWSSVHCWGRAVQDRLTSVIAFHYHQPVTGKDVKRIREALGLSQRQFAERLRVHTVTVAKWEVDMQGMRGPAEQLIELLGQSVGVPVPRKNPGRRSKVRRGASKNRKRTG